MANSFDKLRELNLSRDEVDRLGEALKNQEFRKLLTDYVEELQDPENRKLYEEEVKQIEREQGNDVTFLHPNPGYVIKTSVNGNQKGFINICVNENVKKPSSSPTVKEGARGLQWSLPHSLSPPREDIDNKGVRCQVFDVIFHPDTLHLASKNNAFRNMVNKTAVETVEANFDVTLDKKNLKFPKLSFKGMPRACMVKKPYEGQPTEQTLEEKEFMDKIYAQAQASKGSPRKTKKFPGKKAAEDNSVYTTPKYMIKHRTHVDIQEFTENRESKMNVAIPKELIVEIDLPLLKTSGDMNLDVTEKTVQVTSEKPAKYKLNLSLPYQVNETVGTAKFDKDLKKLVITLPVKRKSIPDYSSHDSGVDSDQYYPGSPESEEEMVEKKFVSEVERSEEHSEKIVEKCTQFRTKFHGFLEENVHYSLPEYTCHLFDNTLAFTLNVKNVDESTVAKKIDDAGMSITVKFTSISSSFYPSPYAFHVKLPSHKIDEDKVSIETWDNNVILQVPLILCDNELKSYFCGVNEDNLSEEFIEEPAVLNEVLQKAVQEENQEKHKTQVQEESTENSQEDSYKIPNNNNRKYIENPKSRAIDIFTTSYESSGDEMSASSFSPRKSRGILKRMAEKRSLIGRSISESSLDDFVCSSYENYLSLDAEIPEDGEMSTSLKKTVRFNDVVTKQLFRSNSSILGQKKKNQRKSRNKKRASERRHSESEASDVESKREGDTETKQQEGGKSEKNMREDGRDDKKGDHDIFHLEINN